MAPASTSCSVPSPRSDRCGFKPYSFGIIGGGWYGCHIATSLRALGFRVKLFEQHNRLLHEASGNNQFRLHMGFHYPRHSDTRIQSRDGFLRFIERYPGLSRSVPHNIYAVPTHDSLVDYATYRSIMASSGVHFTEALPDGVEITNVSGVICTEERVLLLTKARAYFEAELKDALELGHHINRIDDAGDAVYIDDECFDFAIDATWGHYSKPEIPVVYEPTLLLFYEGPPDFPAVTLVDGPLCSIYPTEVSGLFTLSSVPHTPLGQFATPQEARAIRDGICKETVTEKRLLMEEQVKKYLPSFPHLFRYAGPQLAVKTKAVAAHEDRMCTVSRHGRRLSVMSGKIDTVFFATEQILSLIGTFQSPTVKETSSLRDDITMVNEKVYLNNVG
ncbi:putative FAD dependent oxidoreductase [Colletotrichum chrysophilum]|uniref:FAD dependent oxidoreductase n=1 Tax=Colletotrichum chrysophilum TaxID=1836956 RepID=A0AAD8ZZS6_9PEZI|nr:putative FAD dependent oxidoreductase [Colletotrichum chrysophilum]